MPTVAATVAAEEAGETVGEVMHGALEQHVDDASAFVAAAAHLAAQPVADQDGAEDADAEGAEGLDPNLVKANDWRCCLLAPLPHMLQRSTGIKRRR